MKKFITDELMEKTFLFCWKKMADKEDAKDAAQEIIIDALLALRSGKPIENFYTLYWTIANRKVVDFYRKKRPSTVDFEKVEGVLLGPGKTLEDYIRRQEIDQLSTAMAHLAQIHRDILVRFYLKDQSVRQIADELSIPVGTVTGRLSDARKHLKEKVVTMENQSQKQKERKFPKINLDYYWMANQAFSATNTMLAQQILFACRNEKKTASQLSEDLNVSAVFVEDAVKVMLEAKVLFEESKGKYIAGFSFFPYSAVKKASQEANRIQKEINLIPRYLEILNSAKEQILAQGFYGDDLEWNYLLPYFLIRSNREFSKAYGSGYIRERYTKELVKEYNPKRNDCKFYIKGVYADSESPSCCAPKSASVYPYFGLNSPEGYCEYHNTLGYYTGAGDQSPDSKDNWINEANIGLYFEIIQNPDKSLDEHEKTMAADLMDKGILVKENGKFRGRVPVLAFETIENFKSIWEENFTPLAEEYAQKLYEAQKDILLPYVRSDLMNEALWYTFPQFCDLDRLLLEALDVKDPCAGLVILNQNIGVKYGK